MKEIKFRAWNLQQKKMYSFDDLMELGLEFVGTIQQLINEFKFGFEFLQFTGLLDKNGVEIYEGDLLLPYYDDNEIVEVIWHDETASYRAASYLNNCHGGCFAELLFLDDVNDIEVIGNVYENPELLEQP